MTTTMTNVIVLNADYSYLNHVSWKKALILVEKGKVEIVKYSKKVISTVSDAIKLPSVIRLIKLIRVLYRTKVPFSKKNVYVRDNFTCVYCGAQDSKLTIDHVLPKSKGGITSFENCVACCKSCNNKKGSKTCQEARMFPNRKPTAPTINEFLQMKMRKLGVDDIIKNL